MFDIQQDIARHSKKLTLKEPFYGLFLIGLNKVISRQIPTACVSKNGLNCQLTVNDEFWQTLDENTRTAVLKHELLHIAFMHLMEMGKYADKELCNIAMDIEINQFIDPNMKGEKWNGMELTTFPELNMPPKAGTRVYYELLQDAKNNPGKSPTLDKMMAARQTMKVFVDANGNAVVTGGHELWDQFNDLSEAEKKLIQKQIEHQIKETAETVRSRGTIPSELQSMIDMLFEVHEPVINWKSFLRRFAGSSQKIYTKKTRRKPNKRYPDSPALKIKNRKHILVGIDTSGSVSNDDLTEFYHELHHIYKTGTSVTIAECDAALAKVWEYKGTPPGLRHGGGGTDMTPIIELMNNNPNKYNSLVLFTDGYIGSPDVKPNRPMLMVICGKGIDLESLKDWKCPKVKIN